MAGYSNGNGTSAPMDPRELALLADLVYVDDSGPGIRRRVCGRGFTYRDPEGETIRESSVRKRIEALAIPPAWEDVWICPMDSGHIQATGRDAEGRKQYRYHDRWRNTSDKVKFARLAEFGEVLPKLRRAVGRDLASGGLGRQRVAAAAVRLLDRTAMRIGHEIYAEENGAFGVTTLLRKHVRVTGGRMIRISFTAKGGQERSLEFEDADFLNALADLRTLVGDPLFKYQGEEGAPVHLKAEGVNEYLRDVTGRDLSARTFRTWAGTLEALKSLKASGETAESDPVLTAVDRAAELLGNTRATARDFYVHSGLLRAHEARALKSLMEEVESETNGTSTRPGFSSEEPVLLKVLPHLDEYLIEGVRDGAMR